jgi:hypothetical protein
MSQQRNVGGHVLMQHDRNRSPKYLQSLPTVFAICLGLLLYMSLLSLAEAAVEPVIPCLPETDMVINYEDLVDCSIDFNGDSDLFRFAGQDDETVRIQVSELAGTGDACIDLFRPDGSSKASSCAVNRIDTTLDQNGIHIIVVSENNNDETVSYRLTLQCITGICAPFNAPPTLSLTLTGCTACRAGDQFIVQAHLTNPGSRAVLVEGKVGVRLPDGTPVNMLGNKHLEVLFPAGQDVTIPLFSFPWPSGLPTGTWTLEGTLLGPDLGETLSRDVKPFTVVP